MKKKIKLRPLGDEELTEYGDLMKLKNDDRLIPISMLVGMKMSLIKQIRSRLFVWIYRPEIGVNV